VLDGRSKARPLALESEEIVDFRGQRLEPVAPLPDGFADGGGDLTGAPSSPGASMAAPTIRRAPVAWVGSGLARWPVGVPAAAVRKVTVTVGGA